MLHRDESVPLSEVFALPTKVDMKIAAKVLGLRLTTAYRLARAGEFPCRLRKERGAYVIRLYDLMRSAGIQDVRVHDDDIESGARFAAEGDDL